MTYSLYLDLETANIFFKARIKGNVQPTLLVNIKIEVEPHDICGLGVFLRVIAC